MGDFKLKPATSFSHSRLSQVLNQAYTDYYVSIWLNADKFGEMCAEVDVDLARSVVATVGETPVGMALLSRRDDVGWISGVGVRPQWRRRGIARQMLRHLQQGAIEDGMGRLLLEVLEQNEAGLALYRDLGFRWGRELIVMNFEAGTMPLTRVPPGVTAAQPLELLALYDAYHDVPPPWQRAPCSIRHRAADLQGLALEEAGALVGYVLYQSQRDIYAIIDLAVDPDYPKRLHAGQRLLQALHGTRTDVGGYIVNIPAQDPMLPALTGVGYRVWHRQHEMVWDVPF
jgi:ribosomal protein S18 acetylase RimI-like enzyme